MDTTKKQKLITFPQAADILRKVFGYCEIRDLIMTISKISVAFRDSSKFVLNEILNIIVDKYYSTTFVKDLNNIAQSVSTNSLLRLLSLQTIFITRGFVSYKLELDTKKWTRCSDTRRDRGHFAIAYLSGYVYAIGTLNLIATGTVERYNCITNTWSQVAVMPGHLQSVAAAVFQKKLYVIGGINANTNVPSKAIHEYNEENDCWITLPHSINFARSRHSVIEYKGRIWIAGGRLHDEPATKSVELFDPMTGVCEEGPSMTRNRQFGNLLIVDDSLYAIGGDMDDSGQQLLVTRTIEKYNDHLNRWEYVATFKDERKGFSTCAIGSKIYVFGGSDLSESYNDTWDVFDIKSGIWESTKLPTYHKMPQIDDWGQCVTIPHCKITW